MSKESEKVIIGFMRLSSPEQDMVFQQISEFIKKDSFGKKVLKESVEKRAGLDLGPLSQGKCPCCGK
jgi:hypothetical protein